MYYDGAKLLSLQDNNKEKPEIYICCGNRTAGKSVFYKRLLLNNFIKNKKQFLIIYRFKYELSGCSQMFFNDIQDLFFKNGVMEEKSIARGLFYELYYNEQVCGYAVSLSGCDALKKYSSFFINVENCMFDEFQSETNHYVKDEITKFQSLHITIARGKGKQYRYVRTFLVGNTVTILNPYFVALGIHKRLRDNTQFLRGNGWVLEQTYNISAGEAIQNSAFSKAFDSKYMQYAAQNVYLNDDKTFVQNMTGRCSYVCSVRYDGKYYGIREFQGTGIVYVCEKADLTYPTILAFSTVDHDENTRMVSSNTFTVSYLKRKFNIGSMRFDSLESKNMLFDILSI